MTEADKTKPKGFKNTAIFLVFVGLVVAFLWSISGERSNRIPDNDTHKGLDKPAQCLECHGPDKAMARTAKHPPKDECMLCHKRKRTKTDK